jgi:hypothetical protein
MNIEGAEVDAIQGMEKSIKLVKNIAVSCHDFLSEGTNRGIYNTFHTFLSDNNFQIFTENTGSVVRDSWIYGKCKDIF